MEVTNGEINVDLPESLAKLLIEGDGKWEEGSSEGEPSPAPAQGRSGSRTVPLAAERAVSPNVDEGKPIPLTHIPGVVPNVSMDKVRKLVSSGKVPFVKEGRTKLVKPSDVRAALEKG